MNKLLSLLIVLPQISFASALTQRLSAAGAMCAAIPGGHACIFGTTPKYKQPVVILIPPNMDRPQNLVLYLHGHRGVCGVTDSTSPSVMSHRYKLLEQMNAAGASNMVTVFPMSRGSCGDYDNSLVPNFPDFADWAKGKINPLNDLWIMAGHSGAGRAMANILSRYKDFTQKTDIAALLDAAYSMNSYIGRWQVAAGANRRLKIRSFHATSSPEAGSKQLQNTIPSQAKAIRSKANGNHCNVPMTDFSDSLKASALIQFDLAERTVSN